MDTTKEAVNKHTDAWLDKWAKKYPSQRKVFEQRSNLFSYMAFSEIIRRSIYRSNLIKSIASNLRKPFAGKSSFLKKET